MVVRFAPKKSGAINASGKAFKTLVENGRNDTNMKKTIFSHHVMYHIIRRADRVLLWLNIIFFMFVSFLPFSTSVLNAFPEAFIAPLFFGANLTTIGWVLFSQRSYASSQPDMLAGFVSTEYRRTVRRRMLMVPVATTLTMLICFWSVGISLAIYLILLPFYMLPGDIWGKESAAVPDDLLAGRVER